MYKIAVIGGNDSVIGFKALGLDTFPVTNGEETKKVLREIAKPGANGDEYAIIYVEESMAADILPDLAKYDEQSVPAIILIPGRDGPMGFGQAALNAAVEKAIGTNIL